ncbi:MAG: endonuclease domain-containing protein [Methylobacter sp.]
MTLPYDKRLKPNSRSLRSNMTDAEQLLWQRLRRKQINGWQFYRQKPIGQYIVDFYCAAAYLVVELDGSQHLETDHQRTDQQRDAFLQSLGLRVLRFDNRQVLLETDAVVEVIRQIPPNPPFSKGGDGRFPSSKSMGSTSAAEDQALQNIPNSALSIEKSEHAISTLEKSDNSIPPFEKGGLGGINQNPALATEKMEARQ